MSADPSPTTVGIIDAKIKLDAADFLAKIEEVKSAVNGLDRERATVTIDVDVARALAQIEEVRAAAAAVGDGHIGGPRTSVGPVGAEAIASTDALAAAERRERTDATEAAAAERELGNSRQVSARKAIEAAAAARAAADSTDRLAKSNTNAASTAGLLVAGVAALVTMIAPLGGYAVGVAGALGMMGAAGILAIFGIKNAIAAGTAEGLRFQAGLETLDGSFNKLAGTSAHAIAPAFFQSISLIQSAMPMLNTSMGLFGGILGGTVVASIGAVLNIIRQLNPLFLVAATYVRQVAEAFRSWTAGTALQQFGDYAISVLPRVGQVLQDIVVAAFHLAGALAPLGMVVLNLIDGIVKAIDALSQMGPLLSIVAGAALTAFTAFKVWTLLAPIIDRVSLALVGVRVATTAALGPVGLVVAGITLLAGAFMIASQGADVSAKGVTQYSNALLQSHGNVTSAIQAVAQLRLSHSGLAADLQKSGISQRAYTTAVAQGGKAYTAVMSAIHGESGALKDNHMALTNSIGARVRVEQALEQERAGVVKAVAAYNDYRKSLGLSADATSAQLAAQSRLATSMHTNVAALTAAQAAQKQTAAQAAIAAAQFRLEDDAAGLLNMQLDKLNGAAQSDAQAMGAWATSMKSLGVTAVNGKVALTGLSSAALINRAAVASVAGSADKAIAAYADMAHTGAQVTAEWGRMKSQLVDSLVKMGANRAEASRLVNQLMKLPKNVETKVTLRDEQAKAALAQTTTNINRFTGAPHVAKITGDNHDALGKTNAAQAFVDKFAKGNYTAQEKANNTPALTATQVATAKALGFSKAQYQAILRANNGAALSATATAQQRARAFTSAAYMAILKANPNPANSSAAQATARANTFKNGFYQAILRGDASGALAAVRAARYAVMSVDGLVATTYIDTIRRISTRTSVGTKKDGGTIGAASGMTVGTSGTVRGPGSAFDDLAGLYALANGEEVISNMNGQADKWRPLLKAINAGRVSLSLFDEMGRHAPGKSGLHRQDGPNRTVNVGGIHIHQPITTSPVVAAQHASQEILAYVNFPS